MSREFFWRAPAWQADLDAYGEVRTAGLLRLLQETATRASSDAGFDASYYDRTATMWLIRRTTLTRASPARYGDVLEVRTWIADFRRVRSQREYEVRAGERLIARASTDWVFVDRSTGRPRRIPPDWERTFMPGGALTAARIAFSDADAPPNAVTCTRRIELHDLDALRHVNNATYAAYLEQAALDLLHAAGWTFPELLALDGRLRAVAHDVEYLDAALYGEIITSTTWPTKLSGEAVEMHCLLHRGDATKPLLRARSRYEWQHAGLAAAMPSALHQAFETR